MSLAVRPPEERSDAEMRWVSLQPYLLSKGYKLRPRYQPDWVPSWIKTAADPRECEDSADVLPFRTLDAVRVDDQLQVMIKMLIPSKEDHEGEQELEILQYFTSAPHCDDPTNHIVPCLDTFPIPDVADGMFFVMPLLGDYRKPPFYDLSEIHEFLTQIFEGVEFMHRNDMAHCDIASSNIVMNRSVLYDEPIHPFRQSVSLDGRRVVDPKYVRSQKPIGYYYIDFGFAKWFKDPTTPRTATGIHAKERAPEQVPDASYDPFKVDIYQLGAVIRRDLIPNYEPLSFLLSLARDMTNPDPSRRPTIESARHTMHTHFAGLSGWRTRWPLTHSDTTFRKRVLFVMSGLTTELVIFLRRILAIVFLQC